MDFETTVAEQGGDDPRHYVIGDGDATVVLWAKGDVRITHMAPDWAMSDDFDADVSAEFEGMANEISEQVVRQMQAQMEMLERQLNAQMEHLTGSVSAGRSKEMADRISERAREASVRATARAQEKMQRAQERIQRKMEQLERKAEQKAMKAERRAESAARRERRSWGFEWHTPPTPPTPPMPPSRPVPPGAPGFAPSAGASDEERLLILKMLADQKITAEEAEQLLSALEG
jgi:exonuclease VII large subunit